MSATLELPMPKPTNPAPEEDDRKATSTARLPVELLRRARVVSSHRNIDLGVYLVELLERQVDRDYTDIIKPDKLERKPKGDKG